MDISKYVKVYLNLRKAREELSKAFDIKDKELKDKQELIENQLLQFLNETKQESSRTEFGTVYRQEDLVPSAADWSVIYEWIKENDAWELLEKRLKKTFIKTYSETNKGDLPPGVNVFRKYLVRVRKN